MKKWKLILVVWIAAVSCKKPYNPSVVALPTSYMVVEGSIATNEVTIIKLSKTVNLNSKVTSNPVTNASVSVESDNGAVFSLNETRSGVYQSDGTPVDDSRKYRLKIITADNKQYQSDFVQAKNAPPIDSIGFIAAGNKMQLYVNTQDPANNTHYYRFDYSEAWKFHSMYYSQWLYQAPAMRQRTIDEQIYYCFTGDTSSTIVLGSSAKLTKDVLYQLPLTQIESTSEKIEMEYSILVREYGLSEQEYKFWENLKKNTEQLGSIFDAEPTQLSGNVHNTANSSEVVIGYVGAGGVSSKRIFITREQLPDSWRTAYPYDCGVPDTLFYSNPKTHGNDVQTYLYSFFQIPISAIFAQGVKEPIGFLASGESCVDCTIRGSKQQPDFWR